MSFLDSCCLTPQEKLPFSILIAYSELISYSLLWTLLSIISGCSIDKYWRVKTGKEANFHIHKVLDDESINRRILKFGYNGNVEIK